MVLFLLRRRACLQGLLVNWPSVFTLCLMARADMPPWVELGGRPVFSVDPVCWFFCRALLSLFYHCVGPPLGRVVLARPLEPVIAITVHFLLPPNSLESLNIHALDTA